MGADGLLAPGWLQHETIPAELRTDKTLTGVRSLPEVATMLVNAQKLIGRKRAVIPTDPANAAEWDEYYRHVGWPKTADEYPAIAALPNTPKELADDPEQVKSWRAWCHEARLTPGQLATLAKHIQEQNLAAYNLELAEQAKRAEANRTALKTKWQGQYDYNVQLGNTAAAAFADEEELAYAKEHGWLDDPFFLRIMHKVGQAVSPDRLHARSDGGADTAGIQAKIDELMTSAEYRDAKSPRHAAVTAQVAQLFNQLHNVR